MNRTTTELFCQCFPCWLLDVNVLEVFSKPRTNCVKSRSRVHKFDISDIFRDRATYQHLIKIITSATFSSQCYLRNYFQLPANFFKMNSSQSSCARTPFDKKSPHKFFLPRDKNATTAGLELSDARLRERFCYSMTRSIPIWSSEQTTDWKNRPTGFQQALLSPWSSWNRACWISNWAAIANIFSREKSFAENAQLKAHKIRYLISSNNI